MRLDYVLLQADPSKGCSPVGRVRLSGNSVGELLAVVGEHLVDGCGKALITSSREGRRSRRFVWQDGHVDPVAGAVYGNKEVFAGLFHRASAADT